MYVHKFVCSLYTQSGNQPAVYSFKLIAYLVAHSTLIHSLSRSQWLAAALKPINMYACVCIFEFFAFFFFLLQEFCIWFATSAECGWHCVTLLLYRLHSALYGLIHLFSTTLFIFACRYNDISPLENHHCSIAFRLLEHPECNIFKNFSSDTFKWVRNCKILIFEWKKSERKY